MKNKICYFIVTFVILLGTLLWVNNVQIKAEEEANDFTFELNGPEELYLTLNSVYNELGFTAYNANGEDLSEYVTIDSTVVSEKAGVYQVYYYLNYEENTYTLVRTVNVIDFVITTEISYTNNDPYYDGGAWYNAVKTSDGGLLLMGYIQDAYDIYPFICKYSAYGTMEWDLIINYSDYICWDAIEEENRYLILVSNIYYSYSCILSVEKNLEQPTYYSIASFYYSFSRIVEGNNQYVLFSSTSSDVICKLTISGDYVSTSTSYMNYYSNAYNDAFIIDNFLYYRNSNKYIIKYDLLTGVSYNTYSSCKNICYKDDKIYALSSDGRILELDLDLNLLKQVYIADLNGLYASEDCLLSLDTYDNLHFIDYDSLNIYFSHKLNIDNTITTCGYSTFYDNESLIKVGYNSFGDPYYIEFNTNHSICEYEEKECQINDTISFDQHLDNVSFLDEDYEIIFNEESIINTNFDNSQAGIYRYDYLVQTKLGEVEKYFMLSKNVLVNYRTSLVNNEIYVGGVYLDIEGADIYIDGVKYEQGDFYNVEGNSEIILVGQNGYQKTLNITILPGIKNVEDGQEYTESVTPIFSGNNTTLNGEYIAPGTTITKVGHYVLIHTDKRGNKTYCYFTIKENISGIKDGLITNNGLKIYAENCSMSINDMEYLSGDYFNELGKNHQLKVSGEGNYESTYTFTILPDFDDIIVKNNSDSFEINVDEEFLDYLTIKVNEVVLNETTKYETFGKYVIKIILKENNAFSEELKEFYNREYVKYIEPIIFINGSHYKDWDKSQLGEEDIFLGYFGDVENLIIKNISNSDDVQNIIIKDPYTEIGLYNDIKVTIGDFTQTFSFYIEDPKIKLEDFYLEQFVIEKDSELFKLLFNGNYKVFLDGEYLELKNEEPKVEGDEEKEPSDNEEIQDINKKELLIEDRIFCNQIGTHTLSIEGPNGFYKELKFNIVLGELNYNSEEYTVIIPNLIEKVELNGVGVPISENQYLIKFTKLGNNIVKIYGSNGYQTTREYKIGDEVLGLDEDKVALDFPNLNFKAGFEFVKLVIDNGKFEFLYNEMDQFKQFNNYGNHTLKIIGVNGYESKAYSFSVEYDFNKSGISQYNDTSITFIDYDKFENVLIDGVKYDFSNNNRYYVLGHHTITLIGTNDWEMTNSFNICHETDKLLDSTLTENKILYYNDGKMEFNFEGICDEIMIDDKPFDALKGDITSIGFHDITLSMGDYQYTYRICVEPNVSMYDDQVFYDYTVLNIPNVTDMTDVTIIVNDEETRSRIFSEIGNYNVMIKGSKDYVKTFKFTIKEVIYGLLEDEEVEIKKTYFAVPSLPADILVDNLPKTEREIVSEGGKHTITVLGVGGYSAVYTFIIPFDYSVDGNILKSNGGEIFVNGVLVPQDYQLTSIGNNIVQFVGANGYPVEEIEVKIDHKIKIADGGTYKNGLLVPIVDGKVYIDDVEIFEETMIYRHGNHTIKIVGTNDYVAEINVYIKNSNTVIAYVLCVPAALCLVGFVIILIRRKRVL